MVPLAAVEGSGISAGEHLPRGTRAWFIGFTLWMAACTAAAVWLAQGTGDGTPLALRAWILALLGFYLALCNTFVPLPTAWIVLLAASNEYALVEQPALRILLVALLATVATVIANLNEYHVLAWVFHRGWGRRLRRTRVYTRAVGWFDRAPFQLLALIAFVPVPIDAVRWLAVLRGYSRVRFALAYAVGRGPRYVLFAWLAALLHLSARQILEIQLVLVAAVIVVRGGWWLVRRRRRTLNGAPVTLAAAAETPPA